MILNKRKLKTAPVLPTPERPDTGPEGILCSFTRIVYHLRGAVSKLIFDRRHFCTQIETTPEPVKPKRPSPLLSKEEKERLTPEQQKIIARIRRKRRKIAQELEDIEGQKNPIEEFGLLEAAMESWRLGEV